MKIHDLRPDLDTETLLEEVFPDATAKNDIIIADVNLDWEVRGVTPIPVPAKNDFLVGYDDETYINLIPEQVLALIGGASEAYVDDMLLALSWQEQVLAITDTPPGSPTEGDRHIVGTGTGAWENEDNNIATWSGSAWTFQTPQEGWAVWDVDDDALLTFNGSAWVKFGTTVTHNNLSGIQGGDTNERYHLTNAEHTSVSTNHNDWLTNINNESVGDLSDVDITTATPTDTQILKWNDTNEQFEPADDNDHTHASGDLSDFSITGIEDGYVPVWNAVEEEFQAANANAHYHDASSISTGELAVARGGTNIGSYTTGNFIKATGATTLAQRTPAQVVTDLSLDTAVKSSSTINDGALVRGTGEGREVTGIPSNQIELSSSSGVLKVAGGYFVGNQKISKTREVGISHRYLAHIHPSELSLIATTSSFDPREKCIFTTDQGGGTNILEDSIVTFTEDPTGIPITVNYTNFSNRTVTLRYDSGSGNIDVTFGGSGATEGVWQYVFENDVWVKLAEGWTP